MKNCCLLLFLIVRFSFSAPFYLNYFESKINPSIYLLDIYHGNSGVWSSVNYNNFKNIEFGGIGFSLPLFFVDNLNHKTSGWSLKLNFTYNNFILLDNSIILDKNLSTDILFGRHFKKEVINIDYRGYFYIGLGGNWSFNSDEKNNFISTNGNSPLLQSSKYLYIATGAGSSLDSMLNGSNKKQLSLNFFVGAPIVDSSYFVFKGAVDSNVKVHKRIYLNLNFSGNFKPEVSDSFTNNNILNYQRLLAFSTGMGWMSKKSQNIMLNSSWNYLFGEGSNYFQKTPFIKLIYSINF